MIAEIMQSSTLAECAMALDASTRCIEPPCKAVLSNKGMLPLL